jgi:transposase
MISTGLTRRSQAALALDPIRCEIQASELALSRSTEYVVNVARSRAQTGTAPTTTPLPRSGRSDQTCRVFMKKIISVTVSEVARNGGIAVGRP